MELKWADLEDWQVDSDFEGYLVSRHVEDGYRDADRPGDCDVFRTVAEMGESWGFRGKITPALFHLDVSAIYAALRANINHIHATIVC